jgi:hypothetical protein
MNVTEEEEANIRMTITLKRISSVYYGIDSTE